VGGTGLGSVYTTSGVLQSDREWNTISQGHKKKGVEGNPNVGVDAETGDVYSPDDEGGFDTDSPIGNVHEEKGNLGKDQPKRGEAQRGNANAPAAAGGTAGVLVIAWWVGKVFSPLCGPGVIVCAVAG